MTVRIIHTADTHLRDTPKFTPQTPDDLFDAFASLIYRVKRLSTSGDAALIHTGDVFDTPRPSSDLLKRVIDLLGELDNGGNSPVVRFIPGNHDQTGGASPALDRVVANTTAEYLSTSPLVIGNQDLAVYGVHYHENDALADGSLSFDAPPANTPTALCLHATISTGRSPVVRGRRRDFSLDDLADVVPFDLTTVLAGHLHKRPPWNGDPTPSLFYAGAPECVRNNLKGCVPTANYIEVTNYPNHPTRESTVKPVGTYARPWIDIDCEVAPDTTPDDIANEVFKRWETLFHEEYPRLTEQYDLARNRAGMKPPTVDVFLTAAEQPGVSEDFAQAVLDTLADGGQFNTARIRYETSNGSWTFVDQLTA